MRTGLFLGVAQAMALQPGVSRSGVTMTAARAIGIDRETAARFSFLLSLPIIAGAGLFKGVELAQTGLQGHDAEFFWGFVSLGVGAVIGGLVLIPVLGYERQRKQEKTTAQSFVGSPAVATARH